MSMPTRLRLSPNIPNLIMRWLMYFYVGCNWARLFQKEFLGTGEAWEPFLEALFCLPWIFFARWYLDHIFKGEIDAR